MRVLPLLQPPAMYSTLSLSLTALRSITPVWRGTWVLALALREGEDHDRVPGVLARGGQAPEEEPVSGVEAPEPPREGSGPAERHGQQGEQVEVAHLDLPV